MRGQAFVAFERNTLSLEKAVQSWRLNDSKVLSLENETQHTNNKTSP